MKLYNGSQYGEEGIDPYQLAPWRKKMPILDYFIIISAKDQDTHSFAVVAKVILYKTQVADLSWIIIVSTYGVF